MEVPFFVPKKEDSPMKLTIKDLIRLRHCESHYRLGKLGLYAASKRTQFFYQKKDSLILALSKGPTSFSEALEKAFLEYSRDWFLNNRQYETCRDQDLARWHRFADWFFEQGYQILKTRLCSAISVNTSCNHVAVSELSAQADLVLKKGEHVYALSIFPNESQYSVRARKQETQAYYSLELLSQYLISAPAYGQETISMICYLKSKEDKADFLASQYTEGKCYLQMGYGGIAEATQALLSTIQLSVPQKCEYCRYTDVCHQQNTSALAPEKQPEETSIPVPAETVDLEKGLTPEQRRVVEHMDGPMAVIAVPGAGKTHCLIARMVRMIKNGILPEQILFVTFTKKAAGEILERARRVLGEESAFMTKKNIPPKHQDYMKESRFLTVYRYIEVDEDCDLDKMQELEKEFLALGDILGKHPYDASIRFRKLGRHHASGLYSPAYQCVCIDVRSPSSYVHEFLHMYDHFHGMLSEGYDFKEIRLQYEACLQEYLSDCEDPDLKARLNGNSKYNLDYYLVPTEVFARCGELYFTRFRGVDNSLLKFERGFDYPENEKLLELIKKYYDQHFLTEEISL